MNAKRIYAAALALLMLCFTLVGCGGGNEEESSSSFVYSPVSVSKTSALAKSKKWRVEASCDESKWMLSKTIGHEFDITLLADTTVFCYMAYLGSESDGVTADAKLDELTKQVTENTYYKDAKFEDYPKEVKVGGFTGKQVAISAKNVFDIDYWYRCIVIDADGEIYSLVFQYLLTAEEFKQYKDYIDVVIPTVKFVPISE